jgi:hypothetical protein
LTGVRERAARASSVQRAAQRRNGTRAPPPWRRAPAARGPTMREREPRLAETPRVRPWTSAPTWVLTSAVVTALQIPVAGPRMQMTAASEEGEDAIAARAKAAAAARKAARRRGEGPRRRVSALRQTPWAAAKRSAKNDRPNAEERAVWESTG